VKSKIPTPDQMVQIDKEVEIQKSKSEKRKATVEWRNIIRIEDEEEESSSTSMLMYSLDSDGDDSNVPSHQYPIVIIHDAPFPMHTKEVYTLPVTEKVPSE
jgi:hypothetical protein